MALVKCDISFVDLENEDGILIDGVTARCHRCGHETEAYGDGASSVLRCLATMREECPNGETNFYVADDD